MVYTMQPRMLEELSEDGEIESATESEQPGIEAPTTLNEVRVVTVD